MYRQIFLLIIFLIIQVHPAQSQELERYTFQSYHMGTRFNIILYSDDDSIASRASKEAFARIEELNQIMSDYLEESELNRLSQNSGSGEPVEVSEDLFNVIHQSIRMAELSDGLFDITVGPMSKFWRGVRMSPDPQLPSDNEIAEFQKKVDYEHIKLDEKNQTVELLRPDMQLDLGGIAKGYAAEEALNVLQSYGIERALIDAGGDVSLSDPPPGRDSWDVAVPKNQKGGEGSQFVMLEVANRTVTTSGDLFQFVKIDGKRYSHIVNSNTGLGVTNQVQATVISPDGMTADALASILTLMPPDEGISFINTLYQTEAVIFKNDDGNILEWKSVGIERLLK